MPEPDSARLVQTHQVAIWRYLRVLGCTAEEAEDLTQETFLTVLRSPFCDRGERASAVYLQRVARNLFLKSKRRSAGQLDEVALDDIDVSWQLLWGQDGGDSYVGALRTCLDRLRGRGRAALELVYGDGRSHRAAAAALAMSRVGVTNLLRRVRDGLRRCVEREMRR